MNVVKQVSANLPFSVIKTGGKQYLVREGDTIEIEKLSDEHKIGDEVEFSEVLLKNENGNTVIGAPLVKGASVKAKVTDAGRAKKVLVVRFREKSRYRKVKGHRQPFVKVKIEKI